MSATLLSATLSVTSEPVNTWTNPKELRVCARAWAKKIRVQPRRIQTQRMTKKWASCSASGTVTFSTDLLGRDRKFGEAVIVHELLHLVAANHGKLFRSLLRSYMPDAETILGTHVSCGFAE